MPQVLAAALVGALLALAQTPPPAGQRTSGDAVGPYNKQVVDPAAATRGRNVFAVECVDCHGPTARGTTTGPNLVQSLLVMRDRVGTELGPFMKKGHPLQSKRPSAGLTTDQIRRLSAFLKQRVDDALKRTPFGDNINVITGDANAGKAYFEGEGKCTACHSITGNL